MTLSDLRAMVSRIRGAFAGRTCDAELGDEIQAHLDRLAEEHVRRGMTLGAARAAARRDFGGVDQTKEAYRDQRGLPFLETLGQDLGYAMRQLRKHPGFTVAALLTLALGTGANTAIFSLLNATVIGASAFRDANRLVMIWSVPSAQPDANDRLAVPEYFLMKEGIEEGRGAFDRMGASLPWFSNLGSIRDGDPADRLEGQRFSATLFDVLGVQPELGRAFTHEEDRVDGRPDVAIISHRLWKGRFDGDPNVVGRTMLLDGTATTIIGVMPASFRFFQDAADFWLPTTPSRFQLQGSTRVFAVVGHLRPGASIAQAQSQMDAVAAELAARYPDRSKGRALRVQPFDRAYFGDTRQLLLVLQGAVLLILLIACANVAGLLVVRASARHREVTIRCALGADRRRILRQFLTESVLLSLVGAALGVLIAGGGLRLLLAGSPAWLSRIQHVAIDARVLAFTTIVALLAGLAFGTGPGLQMARGGLAVSLKDTGHAATGGRARRRLQRAFVVAQVALTLVLLVGAALVVKSVVRLQRADLGMDSSAVLSFETRLQANKYSKQIGAGSSALVEMSPVPPLLFSRVVDRMREVPGVQSAAGISRAPLNGTALMVTFTIEGRPVAGDGGGSSDKEAVTNYYLATPRFFDTMRIPIVRGRDFDARDAPDTPWVAIVNQAMARRYWPNEDPIGKRVTVGLVSDEQPREIVGLVGDTPVSRWERVAAPILYVPHTQQPAHSRAGYGESRIQMTFMLRLSQGSASAGGVIPAVRRAVAEVDSTIPVAAVQMVDAYLAQQIETPRYYMWLLGMFAAVATTLAVCGIYGVVAYSVAQRAREIAIRMALGANRGRVVALVLRDGVLLLSIGLVLGLAGSLALTRFLSAVLWDVTATDPATFAGVALFLMAVAVAASLVPTGRALRLDPRRVLCDE